MPINPEGNLIADKKLKGDARNGMIGEENGQVDKSRASPEIKSKDADQVQQVELLGKESQNENLGEKKKIG